MCTAAVSILCAYYAHCIKVRDIIKSQQLKLVYEFCNGQLPTKLQKLFRFNSDIHSYGTRSASNRLLYIPRISTSNYGINSVKFHFPTLWNLSVKNGISIDENVENQISIDSINNIHQFKRILKKHYLFKSVL